MMPGAIPEILDSWVNSHARIQEYSSGGGGGGPGQSDKKSSDFFFSPQLILQKGGSNCFSL